MRFRTRIAERALRLVRIYAREANGTGGQQRQFGLTRHLGRHRTVNWIPKNRAGSSDYKTVTQIGGGFRGAALCHA